MKKNSILISLFVVLCSIYAISTQASTGKTDFKKGLSLFESGQYRFAYAQLLKAFDQNPENLELNFYLGRSAFEIQEYEMAVMAYERILMAAPGENRVKLELARAFYGLGANNSARKLCDEVLLSNPPDSVKKNIKRFLGALDKSEQVHFLKGQFTWGLGWNNNVWATPSTGNVSTVIGDVQLTGPSAKKTQDWVTSTTLSVDHTYRFLHTNREWKTNVTGYTAIYKDTSPMDFQFLGITSGPEWQYKNSRRSIKAVVKSIGLGNVEYMSSIGISAALQYSISPTFQTRVGSQLESKSFKDYSNRNADNLSVFGRLIFPGKGFQHDLGLRLERETTYDKEYSFQRVQVTASGLYQLPFNVLGSAGYKYQLTRYAQESAMFFKEQEDHQNVLYANIGKTLWQSRLNPERSISMNLSYQHIWNFSNIDLYEYEQDLVQTFVSYQF